MTAMEEKDKLKTVSDEGTLNEGGAADGEEASVAFGHAPENIILKFVSLCEKHTSLSSCLKSLLERRSKKMMKYEFQPLTNSARDWHVIVSPDEDMDQLRTVLDDLDNYVYKNRLKDRASGIEELLFSTIEDDAEKDVEDSAMDDVRDSAMDNIHDSAADVRQEEANECMVVSRAKQKVLIIQQDEDTQRVDKMDKAENTNNKYSWPEKCSLELLKETPTTSHIVEIIENASKEEIPDITPDDVGSYLQNDAKCLEKAIKEISVIVDKDVSSKKKTSTRPQKRRKQRMPRRRWNFKPTFKCPLCSENFGVRANLLFHCRQVHRRHLSIDRGGRVALVNRELMKCDMCDYVALRGGRMSTHRKKAHGIIDQIQCSTCGKIFNSYRSHNHHVYQFHTLVNTSCDICGKVCRNRSSFQRHYSGHMQLFQCSMCDKSFTDRRCFLQHEKRHKLKDLYSCEHCGRSFNQKANMERHIKVLHLKTGKLMCDICSYTTFYNAALKEHVERVHHGIKKANFTCEHCGKAFARRHTYEEHVDKHEGRYRYSCENCGKRYRNKSGCKKHFLLCSQGITSTKKTRIPKSSNAKTEKRKPVSLVEKENIEEEITLEPIETTHDHMDLVYTITETLVETTQEN